MSDLVDDYLDVTARLEQVSARCDGLIVDVQQRHDALRRWQAGIAQRSPIEELEAALSEFNAGEPPSWGAVQAALREWVAATGRALALWNALPDEERVGLKPPAVQMPEDGGGR